VLNRKAFEERDQVDPLSCFRAEFCLPDELIYLDGNSLGALPGKVVNRVSEVIEREWGQDLIRSWLGNHWMELPTIVGDKIARLIGAQAGEVIACDSTSVNLFKVLSAALSKSMDRNVILSDRANFPTDLYIANGVMSTIERDVELRLVSYEELEGQIDSSIAVLFLTHVDFRYGGRYDMKRITELAHNVGALVIWDLAHSAGAMPVDLNDCEVDFAVGCGYKYLNGGPGAPAFVYVAHGLQGNVRSPLTGWMGHASPFDFSRNYARADGIRQMLCGSPPILSMVALEVGVDLLLTADLDQVRRKSVQLTSLFMERIDERFSGNCFTVLTPREPNYRGSQVALSNPHGSEIAEAMFHRGVVADFRPPDLLRFGFAPLYTRYTDVWDAVETLHGIMEEDAWNSPKNANSGGSSGPVKLSLSGSP
jgi:kynureninase